MQSNLNFTLKMRSTFVMLILVIFALIQRSASEIYDQDPYNYSQDNSGESDSNELYNNININDENNDNSNDNEKILTVTTEKAKKTITPKVDLVKTSFDVVEESSEDTESKYNSEMEVSSLSPPQTSIDTTPEEKPYYPVKNVTLPQSPTAKPPAHFQDCKDKQYHAPDKTEEDKCTSTLVNYPFSVSLQRKGAHYATGALLDKRWILSVASEFYNVRDSLKIFRARLGSVDCKRGGTLIPLKRVEIHPSYVYGQLNYDLALLRMAQPVDYTDFIRPIGLSNIRTKVISAKFMTTYWPRLIVRGKVLPATAKERIKQNSMRVSTQRLVPRDKCVFHLHDQNVTLDDSTLCLKPVVTHHSPCMPDAGAPVVAEDGLWGITSGWISRDCIHRPSPTVFSRLSSITVRSWLDLQLITI